jgi:hypothetical protein
MLGLGEEHDELAMQILIKAVEVAAVKNGLDPDVLSGDEVREIVSILAAQERLEAIAVEKAAREDVQRKASELIQLYIMQGKVPGVPLPGPAPAWTPAASTWQGPNFSGATIDPRVTLRSAHIEGGNVRLDYDPLPADWPKQVNAPGMLCLFTKQADGSWLGGKFEWLDPGQTSKSLGNINNGYNGWSRPATGAETAVVIFSTDGSRHSNPAYTTWR